MDKVVQLKGEGGENIYPIILDGVREPRKFDCCFGSHRGFCGEYPENTMIAFKQAVKRGYRYLETDVVQSSDGVQFLLHDATINRTSNGSGTASALTSTQLKSYNFGYPSKFGSKFSTEKIPTLEEFLLFCKRNHCFAELDIADDSRYKDSYVQNTYDIVKRTGMLDYTFFCANQSRLDVVLSIDPSAMVSVSGMTSTTAMSNAYTKIKDSKFATFSCQYNSVTQALINHAHNLGVPIKTWYNEGDGKDTTANADKLFDMGLDIILTDFVTPNDFQWLK